jgi:hypothetical protein
MIILDYNQIALSNIIAQKLAPEEDLIRHMILNSIRMYNQKFKKDYGQVVIASDGAMFGAVNTSPTTKHLVVRTVKNLPLIGMRFSAF